MYVRLVQFSLGTGKRPAATAVADKIVPAIRGQKGCDRCEFITDDSAGDYGIVVLWASKEAAEAAYEVINPMLQPALSEAGAQGTSIRFFEVYEPKK
jgi:quinol monooxygenase YgiN